jgi:hypothetical protein
MVLGRRTVVKKAHAESEATRVAAIKEAFDRFLGKASQPVDAQLQLGISAELERILQQCDGQSRSLPTRGNGTLLLTEADTEQFKRAIGDIAGNGRAVQSSDHHHPLGAVPHSKH